MWYMAHYKEAETVRGRSLGKNISNNFALGQKSVGCVPFSNTPNSWELFDILSLCPCGLGKMSASLLGPCIVKLHFEKKVESLNCSTLKVF